MKHYIKRSDLRHHYRTTKSDKLFQKRILKYLVYGLPMFTLAMILFINFVFFILTGKSG